MRGVSIELDTIDYRVNPLSPGYVRMTVSCLNASLGTSRKQIPKSS